MYKVRAYIYLILVFPIVFVASILFDLYLYLAGNMKMTYSAWKENFIEKGGDDV